MSKSTNYTDSRDAVFTELEYLMMADENIVVLSGDTGAFKFETFKKQFPGRFYNVGVAEQNMMSVAAGLALAGKKPVVYGISNFVTLRCFEQIKLDICAMNLPVVILGSGTGFTYAHDGVTHQITEDVALMRTLPNMTILSPSDYNMAGSLLRRALLQVNGPCYLRFDKGPFVRKYDFEADQFQQIHNYISEEHDPKKVIIATGVTVDIALAYQKEYPDVQVIDILQLHPPFSFKSFVGDVEEIIVIEEHSVVGGLGDMVMNLFPKKSVKKIGIKKFIKKIGNREELRKAAGIKL